MSNKTTIYNFFALPEDLIPILEAVETGRSIKYVQTGLLDHADRPFFATFAAIPKFGLAETGDSNLEPTFLVMSGYTELIVRPVLQKKVGIKYAVDQLQNPGTTVLRPGGRHGNSAVIAGMVGTIHQDKEADNLIKVFAKALREHFIPIRSYLVGPAAKQFLNAGARLTKNIKASHEYDLTAETASAKDIRSSYVE